MPNLKDLTEKDWEEIAESLRSELKLLAEEYEEIQNKADAMEDNDLYAHLKEIIDERNGSFWDYRDDYLLEQTVERKLIDKLEEAMMVENQLKVTAFVDLDLMTQEQARDYMFADSNLHPFTLDDHFYVGYAVYGQGERFFVLKEVNKEDATYIKQYVDLNNLKRRTEEEAE